MSSTDKDRGYGEGEQRTGEAMESRPGAVKESPTRSGSSTSTPQRGREMSQRTKVPASEIQVNTAPPTATIGAANVAAAAVPRPDYAGLRVMEHTGPAIYLIDPDGYRRWIPDPTTFNNLFRDWSVERMDLSNIPEASPLTSGAVLAIGSGTAPVYLVSNGVKRWITSGGAMDKYNFKWEHVVQVPRVLVDSIPSGPSWS
jgi:hypothetical protein